MQKSYDRGNPFNLGWQVHFSICDSVFKGLSGANDTTLINQSDTRAVLVIKRDSILP
jgi:hypothetical protein